jgi:hypothetical protein
MVLFPPPVGCRPDRRYMRRDRPGQFSERDDVRRSLSQDQPKKAKSTGKEGQGDRGDRKG